MTIQTAILFTYLMLAGLFSFLINPWIGIWMLVGYIVLLIIVAIFNDPKKSKK